MPSFDEAFEELMDKGEIVNGRFSCQTCGEVVSEAHLRGQSLIWKCSSSHISTIKEFLV